MGHAGPLESMARADLDAVLQEIAACYERGTLEALATREPEWWRELERAERDVGALFQTLCEADAAIAEWRHAVAELSRLWRRVRPEPEESPRAAA